MRVHAFLILSAYLLTGAALCWGGPSRMAVAPESGADQAKPTAETQPVTVSSPALQTETSKQEAVAPPEPVGPGTQGDLLWAGIRSVGALIAVLGLILGATYGLKKYMPGRFGALGRQKLLQILESASLGDRRSLHLVKVREDYFLIGSTPNQLALLEKFPHPQWLPAVAAADSKQAEEKNSSWFPALKLESQGELSSSSSHKSTSRFGSLRERSAAPSAFDELVNAALVQKDENDVEEERAHLARLTAIRQRLQAQ